MSLIKNIDALNQPLDFSPFVRYCKVMSDLDCILWLYNDRILLIEIKKDTFNHTKDKIRNSYQWKLLRKIAGNRPNVYLIYATHNQPIDLRVAINSNDCIVKYIEYCGKEVTLDCSDELPDIIHYFSLKEDISNSKYHIIVKYPDYSLQHAIRKPVGPKWTLSYYSPVSCDFESKKEAIKYIQTRFKTDFNRNNIYILMQKDEDGNDLIVKQYAVN